MLCELRLWLAIVSPSNVDVENVPPLPNLDRNIHQGNSLLAATDFLATGRRDVYASWRFALVARERLIDAYRHAVPSEKAALARAIRESDSSLARDLLRKSLALVDAERNDASQATIAGAERVSPRPDDRETANIRAALARVEKGELDFFAYDVHMAHVVASGGFDVIVGNPPWVRHARIDPTTRAMLSDRYPLFANRGDSLAQGDLAIAFCEKSLGLLAPGGVVSLLLPSKVLSARYARRLRGALSTHFTLRAIEDHSHQKGWFQADTFPAVISAVRRTPDSSGAIEVVGVDGAFTVQQSELSAGRGEEWLLLPAPIRKIINYCRSEFEPLTDCLGRSPLMGVKSGANRLFIIDDITVDHGRFVDAATGVAIPPEALCRLVRGRDVSRWKLSRSHWMLWPPRRGWREAPAWLRRIAEARGFAFDALRLAYIQPEHLGLKVVWKDVSRGMQAVVVPPATSVGGNDFPLVPNQTTYMIEAATLDEAHWLAAMFNSTIVDALLLTSAERAKDDHFRYFASKVAALPLPRFRSSDSLSRDLVRMARRAEGRGADQEAVDDIVRRLFRLSAKEAGALREYAAARLRR
jgi:hypothetical protein